MGRRTRWISQGYQWACMVNGDPEGCAGSDGGFISKPYADIAAEAHEHRRVTGHPVQIDEMRSRRFPDVE